MATEGIYLQADGAIAASGTVADLQVQLPTTLEHFQTPVPADRVLATEFGGTAVDLLMSGEQGRLVVMKGRTVTHIPLEEAADKQRLVPLDLPLLRAARAVGTCFGD